jgi:hypothetical protein
MAQVRKLRVRSFIFGTLVQSLALCEGCGARKLRRFVVKLVVLADHFWAGRFATNKFWRASGKPASPLALSLSPGGPIRSSYTGRLSV